jgi:hypothetical protein
MTAANDAQPRTIGLEPIQPKEMLRRALLLGRNLRTRPIRHRSHRPKAMAITATRAWIIGANSLALDQLGGSIMPRTLAPHIIGRGIPIRPLQRR